MNIIVTVDKNWGIGYKGKQLYNFKQNRGYFDELTCDKIFVMGRKTCEGLFGTKLPKRRINMCLTSDKSFKREGLIVFTNLKDLFEKLCFYNTDNIFVIGGEDVYKQLLPYCKYCYVTKVEFEKKSDAFFENLDLNQNWKLTENSNPYFESNTIYYLCKYENKNVQKYNFGYEKEDLF